MIAFCKYFGLFLSLSPLTLPLAFGSATNLQEVDYGEMYVIQKHQTPEKQWETSVSYSYAFSNPYISIHGIQLGLHYHLTEFVSIGLSPNFYTTTDKNLAAQLKSQLGDQGIYTQVYQPQHATYFSLSVNPISGMINWFHLQPVNFDLNMGAGIGYAKYLQRSNLIASFRIFAIPEIMLSKSFGVMAGVETTIDRFSAGDWQNRVDALFGGFARF